MSRVQSRLILPATPRPVALPSHGAPSLALLLPLWRYAVVIGVVFGIIAVSASLRVECQQLKKDLDRNTRLVREARVLQERLELEQEARVRVAVLQATSEHRGFQPAVRVTSR